MLLLLTRHAHTAAVGRLLAGRAPGHRLSETGRAEAQRLARRLRQLPLAGVYASPLERAQETAAAIAEPHGLQVETLAALHELDYGEWTGHTFDELQEDLQWRAWNEARSATRVPGGEAMQDVQRRVVGGLEALASKHAGEVIAAVSHADVVRAALGCWLGMPVDLLQRLEVAPASTSGVMFDGAERRVLWTNDVDGAGRAAAQ